MPRVLPPHGHVPLPRETYGLTSRLKVKGGHGPVKVTRPPDQSVTALRAASTM